MLHVILLILKILGIILLVILGLLLLVVCAVLFVVVSYRVRAEKKERIRVSASAAWLFRILTVWFSFEEGSGEGPILQVRLFGFPILRILGEEKPEKTKKAGRRLKWGRKPKKDKDVQSIQPSDEPPPVREEAAKEEDQKTEEAVPDHPKVRPTEQIRTVQHTAPKAQKQKRQKKPFFVRIFEKIEHMFDKIRGLFKGIWKKLTGLGETFQKLKDRKDALLAFWNLEEHKRAREALWKEARYLWRKSRPKKIKGRITFGFADPAYTGLSMGAAGMLCAWYPKRLEIIPDFEQEILKGEIEIRGRIRCYIFVRVLLRVYFHKDIRHMYQHWKEL